MNKAKISYIVTALMTGAAALLGCAEKPAKPGSGSEIVKTLKDAEKDARSGSEGKVLKEIDAAEQALIKEDKQHPYPQPNKQFSGEDVKAKADRDAMNELEKARRDAKAQKAGDAADDVNRALKDVEKKEGM